MEIINYHMKEPKVSVLGPGLRYVLWVQGCSKCCEDCVAPDAREIGKGDDINTGALAWEIALSDATGITISGGEPFLQAEACAELIRKVRRIRPMNTIVFTGWLYEDLLKDESARKLLDQTDLLIDGEYIPSLNDNKGLRGSSNQHLIFLTDALKPYEDELNNCQRKTQTFDYIYKKHIVGIPAKED